MKNINLCIKIFFNSIASVSNKKRSLLNFLAVFIAIIALTPLINLIQEGFNGLIKGSVSLGTDGFKQIQGSFTLMLFTSIFGGLLGTTNGWLLANCRFKGRKILRIFQLIPLATPAYLLSATLIDLGSINAIRIHGMAWGVFIMSMTTYPYVFLLSTESFSICGKRQLEACRTLGIGPWESFRRVALPIALPAIGAGIALMGMEVLNELGAVRLLNIPSISAGIEENWTSQNNPSGAIGLSLIALLIVICLITYERLLRHRSRRWTDGIAGGQSPNWVITGWREFTAQAVGLLPPLFTLGVPILWVLNNLDQITRGLDFDLLLLTGRSLIIGLLASVLTVLSALILSVAKRWDQSNFIKFITFISGVGYAIPGVVLAIALLSFGGPPWSFSPFILLIWGYSDRFLAVAKGGLDAAFERISPNIDEAATTLGADWKTVLRKIHIPLLKGPLTIGVLLVFVDTLKELPLTFVLRPFDFDTLSVRIFQYASDERLAESILPALFVLLLGLIASIALIPSLENYEANNENTD